MSDKVIYPTDNGVGHYELEQCYRCGGAMESVHYRGPYTWYRDGKPSLTLQVSRVPYTRCRDCGNTLHDDATDEMLVWWYNQHKQEATPQ